MSVYASSMTMKNRLGFCQFSFALIVSISVLSFGCLNVAMAQADAKAQAGKQLVIIPEKPADIMLVEDLRIGMKGYGLTVFAGTKIEPFPVEVVTVIKASQPGRALFWIESDMPRLVNSGPAQGMSGSPIYLWPEGETGTLGEGGKLAGAFAFGYGGTVGTCLAGVQPIEYMLDVGERISEEEKVAQKGQPTSPGSWVRLREGLDQLASMPDFHTAAGVSATSPLFDAVCRMSRHVPQPQTATDGSASNVKADFSKPQALRLPMSMPESLVAMTRPLFEPMGLMPVASDVNTKAGTPPPGIDPMATTIQPGSVITVPLAFGDMDLAGSGTVTHVTPEGKILAFGHAMNNLGDAAVPFASGYVQMFVPMRGTSFKRGGSLQILGTVLRDESAAIACLPEKRFTTAPVKVKVQMTRQEPASFNYEVVHDPGMTARIAGVLPLMSLLANQNPPLESTLEAEVELDFGEGRNVTFKTLSSPANPTVLAREISSLVMFMQNNPFERIELQGMKANVRMREGIEAVELVKVWTSQTQVQPGDEVTIYVQLKPLREDMITRSIKIKIPQQTPEGDYPLIIGGPDVYAGLQAQSNPQLFSIRNMDQAFETLETVTKFPDTGLYAGLLIPNQGLAVGRSSMPNLPGSRAVVLMEPASEEVVPVPELVEQSIAFDQVIVGQSQLMISVREPYRGVDQPQP